MSNKPFIIPLGKTTITGVVQLLDLVECSRYVTEATAQGGTFEAAAERMMMRRLVSLEVDGDAAGALDKARARVPNLPIHIADLLSQAAGLPVKSPALKAADELDASTPPFVLAAAGLTREKADKLLAEFDAPQRLVRITDSASKTIFAAVLRTPDEHERQILSSARAAGKGVPGALLSIARSCITWSLEDIEGAIGRYPAIPLLSLIEDWDALGGSAAEARFC